MPVITKTYSENLFITEAGEGTPIVFIHGSIATGMDTYARQIECFSGHYHCICPDLSCHGKSISRHTFWTSRTLAEDIIRMMDRLNIDKAHFVGHSMGGEIMMYDVLHHEDRVLTASSICSSGFVNKSIETYLKRFDPDKLDPEIHSDFIDRVKREHGYANHGDWKGFIKHTIWNCICFPGFSDDDLRHMNRPFQLIRGKKDRLIKDYEVERLKMFIPDFRVTELDGGHDLTSDEKTAPLVNSLISSFIAENDKPFSQASHDVQE